jgi:putative thiamine transport system permease protein
MIWVLASVLDGEDVKQNLAGQGRVARSLGHGGRSIWLGIILPQILPRIAGPLIAVWAYGLTVVDLALTIGPTQPPTLAGVIWTDLNDAEVAINNRGAVGAILLAGLVAAGVGLVYGLIRGLAPFWRKARTGGPTLGNMPLEFGRLIFVLMIMSYGAVLASLLILSVAGHWPFPQLLPTVFSSNAWRHLWDAPYPFILSLVLGLAASGLGLLIVVAWLEWVPQRFDVWPRSWAFLAVALPGLLLATGQYRLLLWFGATGTLAGVFFVHVLPTVAYGFLVLAAPYRRFDPRWQSVGRSLGRSGFDFWWCIKYPLLKAPLWSALAIGFAVSVAQFVGPQLAASGRYSTLPMEAVTLSAGSNRPLTAVFALVQMVLPLAMFALAALMRRPRWRQA